MRCFQKVLWESEARSRDAGLDGDAAAISGQRYGGGTEVARANSTSQSAADSGVGWLPVAGTLISSVWSGVATS